MVAFFWGAASSASVAAAGRIHLPTRKDAIAAAASVEQLLNGTGGPLPSRSGLGGLETKLPGSVTDDERITAGFDLSGRMDRVHVVQRLHLTGLGDFRFKVPGPAIDVTGLPGSEEQPGLRKGAVLWQGFSPGHRTLAAVLDLHPELEAGRLPIAIHLDMTIAGRPVRPGVRESGPFALTLRIANQSAVPVTITPAPADPAEVGSALDATRAALRRHEPPTPGSDGLPTSLTATGPASSGTEQLEAPFRIEGGVVFPHGTVTGLRASGGLVRSSRPRVVGFGGELGGGAPLAETIRVTGAAHRLAVPRIEIRALPAPPLPSSVAPPSGGTWTAYAASHPARSTQMVSLLLETLWRTARLASFDAYLGNPDPFGPAHSTYAFRLAPPQLGPAVALSAAPRLHPFGIVLVALLALLALAGVAVAWSRA